MEYAKISIYESIVMVDRTNHFRVVTQVSEQVCDQVREQVKKTWDKVGDQVINQMWKQVWHPVDNQVFGVMQQVWEQARIL